MINKISFGINWDKYNINWKQNKYRRKERPDLTTETASSADIHLGSLLGMGWVGSLAYE